MTVTIDPFLLGVITTLLVQFVLFIVWSIIQYKKYKDASPED